MISIHFQDEQNCRILFKQLESYVNKYIEVGLKGRVECSDGNVITILYDDNQIDFYESFQPLLVNLFTKHIIKMEEEEWLLTIIETMFYFKDYEEQQQILSIARAILEGDNQDIPHAKTVNQSREKLVYKALSKFLVEETSFYYESFLKFRLKDYYEQLIDTVEMAIDEYMLEQEYQHMVENLRYYVKRSKPIFQSIHLVHDQKFYFYNDEYRLLQPEEIELYLDEMIKFEDGLKIEDIVISPLVSLAPKKITLYTDQIDHGVVQTIQNIFEERVTVLKRNKFGHNFYKEASKIRNNN